MQSRQVLLRSLALLAAVLLELLPPVHAGGITLSTESQGFNEGEYMENSIITSLNNCPMCRGKEPCLMNCKQKEHKSWHECLDKCLGDNPMLLDVFESIVRSSSQRLKGFGS
mmetsp:Transcript_115732/g.210644  ORF Transcript_115732/g.210644 Transcript_115732/m.210644 type:complete len:112 (+) Transcript_115732:73-408(+)